MTTPNRDLFDAQVKRRIFLERLSRKDARELEKFILQVQRETLAKLAALRERGASFGTIRQKQRFLDSVNDLHQSIYARLREDMNGRFQKLARDQADFEAEGLVSTGVVGSVNTLTARQAYAAFRSRPLEDVGLLKDMVKNLEPGHRKRITDALRTSFVQGENLSNASARLRGQVMRSRRGLNAFIRTANTHIAASVQEAFYEANSDLVGKVEWRSVLDNRTTRICAARDGNIYKVGEGPRPPAHFGCRSVTRPILDGEDDVERETYPTWFARQDAATQKDILGAGRYRLYKNEGFEIKDFVDFKGRTLRLDELT